MKITQQYLRQIIKEEFETLNQQNNVDDLTKKMMQSLEQNMSSIEQAGKQASQQTQQNKQEVIDPVSITLLYSGVVAAIPAILKTIGWVQKQRGKLESAEQFNEWHHKWHHSWINMLKKTFNVASLGKFSKLPPDKQNKIAERFYLVIIAYLFGTSAVSLIKHYSWLTPIEGILSSIKGGELSVALVSYVKGLFSAAG